MRRSCEHTILHQSNKIAYSLWVKYHQHMILHQSNEITYFLWVKNEKIPSAHNFHRSNKITYFLRVKNGEISSEHGSALIQRDHILSAGEKWGNLISTRFYINPTRSHTFCGQEHKPSADDSALIQRDRVLPVGEEGRDSMST